MGAWVRDDVTRFYGGRDQDTFSRIVSLRIKAVCAK